MAAVGSTQNEGPTHFRAEPSSDSAMVALQWVGTVFP
jgi:hypothetical protein